MKIKTKRKVNFMKTKTIIASLLTSLTLFSGISPVLVSADVVRDIHPQTSISDGTMPLEFDVSGGTLSFVIYEDSTFSNNALSGKQQKISDAISDYYSVDSLGNVDFTASETNLVKLGLSEKDAKLMVEDASENETLPSRNRGFVGLYINLGDRTRSMSPWAAGIYMAAYLAWYLKEFVTTASTAVVTALITAAVGVSISHAVRSGIRRISIGVNVPRVLLAYSVNTP